MKPKIDVYLTCFGLLFTNRFYLLISSKGSFTPLEFIFISYFYPFIYLLIFGHVLTELNIVLLSGDYRWEALRWEAQLPDGGELVLLRSLVFCAQDRAPFLQHS